MNISKEQLAVMSPEDRAMAEQLMGELERRQAAKATGGGTGGGFLPKVGNVIQALPGALALGMRASGNTDIPAPDTDMTQKVNTLIATEKAKRAIEGDPMENYKREQEIKASVEANDPYKKSQIALNQAMLENIKGGGAGGDLIYRDPATGMDVPQEEALGGIAQGKQYIINRRVATKQGVREDLVSKPEDLTQEEKNYVTTSDRIMGALGSLQNDIYPRLNDPKYNKDWAAFQAQNVPFMAIQDQNIQDFKSALTQLKADIPFLRGGKALTGTEAKRVDILLNPFGKSDETKVKDIERFKQEFLGGAALIKGGIRELNKRAGQQAAGKSVGSVAKNMGDERGQAMQVLMSKGYTQEEAERMLGD